MHGFVPRRWLALAPWWAALAALLSACASDPHSPGDVGPVAWPTLPAGSRYFETAGRAAPLFLRNVCAGSADAFSPIFADARAAGTTVVRLQLTQGFGYDTLGIDSDGGVLPGFVSSWEAVLTEAERNGLAVIPVFAIWGDWNDGTPALGWTHFDANPLGAARGGPAASPAELFADDSETQRRWLRWLATLVERWTPRPNIIAWETFSELDLATGATEASATAFATRAGDVVRALDPQGRPVLASTSDLPLINGQPWTTFWGSAATDLVSLHTYDADLDRAVIERTRLALAATSKPVLLGESGLDAAAPDGTTLTSSAAAPVGLESAIWAEMLSGSASARALYWEDGYAAYFPGSGSALVTARKDLERGAREWITDKDFQYLARREVSATPSVIATAVGSFSRVFGWARNDRFTAPAWDAPRLDGADVRVSLPGAQDGVWTVNLTALDDGATFQIEGTAQKGTLSFRVAMPFNRLAFAASVP